MLSIVALGSSDSSYYFRYPSTSLGSGTWMGRGSTDLGLSGPVAQEALDRLLAGRNPQSDSPLPRSSRGPERRTNLGYDAVFRAPKSVSLLAMLGAEDIASKVRDAHRRSVEAGFAFLEEEASALRKRKGGVSRYLESGGFAAGAFTHFTSRAQDPHLHTHVVFANLGRDGEGCWSAFNSAFVWAASKTAGCLYSAHLRHELTRDLGLEWNPVRNGVAELSGVDAKTVAAFSTRAREIRQTLEADGIGYSAASARRIRIAARVTRDSKSEPADVAELLDGWHRHAEKMGLDAKAIDGMMGRTGVPEIERSERDAAELRLSSSREVGLSGRTLARAAIRVACETTPPGADPDAIRDLARAAEQSLLVRRTRSRSFSRDSGRELSIGI